MMKKYITALLSIFFWALLGYAQERQLVLKHVGLIDMKHNYVQKDMTVVITGNKITTVGKGNKVSKNAVVIDAHGKYVIPGLWDMHAHMIWKVRLPVFIPLYLANGITGIRDMGALYPEFLAFKEWQKRAVLDHENIPRIITPGSILDGPRPTNSSAIALTDTINARQKIRELKMQEVDFIKVYNLLPRDIYFTIIDEAKKQGLPVSGHVPFAITIEEAIMAGQRSIEHLNKCILSCSKEKDRLEEELRLGTFGTNGPQSWQLREIYDEKALATKDKKVTNLLYQLMNKAHVFQCPTLVIRSFFADSAIVKNYINQPYIKYYPDELRNEMLARYNTFFAIRKPEGQQRAELLFKESLVQVKSMHDAGVSLLAGTDVPGFGTFPGVSLHKELLLFVEAGLSPYEALKTATINPAKYLGRENELGTIEKGKLADLVLLDANPLENIGNTQKIFAVIINGKLITRQGLDKMLKLPMEKP